MSGRLFRKLLALDWCLRRYQDKFRCQNNDFDGTLERGQGRVIALLQIREEIPTKDLGYILGIRQQSLNELLQKLESRGFVVREPSPEDRRILLVRLTQEGKALKIRRTDPEPIFSCLTPGEETALDGMLDKLLVQAGKIVGAPGAEEFAGRARCLEQMLGKERFREFIEERLGTLPADVFDNREC